MVPCAEFGGGSPADSHYYRLLGEGGSEKQPQPSLCPPQVVRNGLQRVLETSDPVMGGHHMLYDNYIPRKVSIAFAKLHRNPMPQRTKVTCKLLSRPGVSKNHSEIDIARSSQIVSLRFHATKRISIGIVGIYRQIVYFLEGSSII